MGLSIAKRSADTLGMNDQCDLCNTLCSYVYEYEYEYMNICRYIL